MGVGAIGDQHVGRLHHQRRDIAVQVDAGDERDVRPDRRPHAAQDLALPVIEVLAHHRAVQVQVDPVGRQRRADAFDQFARQRLEGLDRDMGGGAGGTPQRRYGLPAPLASRLDETGGSDIDVPHRLEDRRAAGQRRPAAPLHESIHARLAWREGVGLVQETTEDDARRHQQLRLPAAR